MNKLIRSKDWLEVLFQFAPDAYYVNDLDGIFLDGNRAAERLTGYEKIQLIGKNLLKIGILQEDQIQKAKLALDKNARGESTGPDEFILNRKDGMQVPVEIRTYPVHIEGRTLVLGIARDISERKNVEEALRDTERKYRIMSETFPDGVTATDLEGRVTYASKRTLELHGYTNTDELLGMSAFEFIAPNERERAKKNLQLVMKEGIIRDVEYVLLRKDGSRFQGELSAALLKNNRSEPIGFLAITRDISLRKHEQKVHAMLAKAIEQAEEIVTITDKDLIILYANPALEKISSFSKKEVLGKSVKRVFRRRPGISMFNIVKTLDRGKVWKGQLHLKNKSGNDSILYTTVSPVHDSKGNVFSYVFIMRDVTHDQRMEERLRRTEKMEALGTLTGGIAHDFNNILSCIIGFTELALDDAQAETQLNKNLKEIMTAGIRGKELVKQILTFSRQEKQEKILLHLGNLVREILAFLRPSIPASIEIRKDLQSDAKVMADPTQIQQVLMNLCSNAAHAMDEKGGVLEVRLIDLEINSDSRSKNTDVQPGKYLRLTVSDTGHGIENSIQSRIFDPFFTTKEKGRGTGMGLAVVHKIVESLGGIITVYSRPKKGSTFHVFLPRAENLTEEKDIMLRPIKGGRERILLVDDEEQIVKFGKVLLERLGYQVTVQINPLKALETFRSQADCFDLIITDMTMPSMNGDKLAKEFMRIQPNIPIILSAGLSTQKAAKKIKSIGVREVVNKPFLKIEIAEAIRRVLDSKHISKER
jgi:PAS domain S-box-containing protein